MSDLQIIIFLVHLLVWSIRCQDMVKYVNQCVTKARDEVIKCEFCPQQRDTLRKRINATVKKKKIKKKMCSNFFLSTDF